MDADDSLVEPLVPKGMPGRPDRKVRGYCAQIQSLRAAGYTYAVIRQALADVGVHVSIATVKREARRRPVQVRPAVQPSVSAVSSCALPTQPVSDSGTRVVDWKEIVSDPKLSPREAADRLLSGRQDEPFMRRKIPNEGRSD